MQTVETVKTHKVRMTDPQAWAMHSLLCTVFGQYQGLDFIERGGLVMVTIWKHGDPTTYVIAPDGETKAL